LQKGFESLHIVQSPSNNAVAEEWSVVGTVVQVGVITQQVYIAILDDSGNLWPGIATLSLEEKLLAIGQNAFSIGATVQGIYDTDELEWLSLVMLK
jgi:hypothetical protein